MASRPSFSDAAKEFPKDMEGRAFPRTCCTVNPRMNRKNTERDWVVYSRNKEVLLFLPCLLFSSELDKKSCRARNTNCGMEIAKIKWRKLYYRLPEHENCSAHHHCYWKWKNLQRAVLNGTGEDSQE